ncbi:hypothetical protein N7492_001802 [Penicillium capsulatum]|uniref:Uncharacterized protein n=1 Tax=Penicillium capsulatum TaxID=69766 RepID=A0A9W9IYH1_9EURO|nr:hypothetical protein N7492_001802 [Penicillium capsulatum]KAJ6129148.1 hypothetical protein N7512_001928 [Penicillium capsulatum]
MFKATTARLYQLVGKTKLNDLPFEWRSPVSGYLDGEEKADPNFKNAEIRGSKPHPSHDDPDDNQDVVSIRLKDGDMKTIRRVHVHLDGSVKKINV